MADFILSAESHAFLSIDINYNLSHKIKMSSIKPSLFILLKSFKQKYAFYVFFLDSLNPTNSNITIKVRVNNVFQNHILLNF